MNKFFILLYLLILPAISQAQNFNLLDPNVPIASHQKRGSRFKIEKDFYLKDFVRKMGAPEDSIDKTPEKTPNLIFSFRNFVNKLPTGAGTYDGKPDCEGSEVRRAPVLYDSEELKFFDIVYYNYQNSSQTSKSRSWELPTAPYLEGDLFNPYRTYNLQQDLARFFDIRCLPTRIHFPTIDGQKYEEYREGSSAWEK